MTEQFVVTEIKGLEESDDMDVLAGAVQSGTEVGVRGNGIDLDIPLRYEGGSDTWMVRWGYKFCHGSLGIKEHIYNIALEILSSLELDKIIHDFSDMDQYEELKKIVRYYRYLSETQLVTIKDLLRFMLTVKACFPAQRNSLLPTAKPADTMEKTKPATRESLKIKLPMKEKSLKYRKFATVVSHMDSRWPAIRLEFSADVIVNALKEKKEKA